MLAILASVSRIALAKGLIVFESTFTIAVADGTILIPWTTL
jgi:hypothetical protein